MSQESLRLILKTWCLRGEFRSRAGEGQCSETWVRVEGFRVRDRACGANGDLPGPPKEHGPISPNREYRQYGVHYFGHFGGPGISVAPCFRGWFTVRFGFGVRDAHTVNDTNAA